jgi:predicted transcriptional regulator
MKQAVKKMTVNSVCSLLYCEVVSGGECLKNEVRSGYCGDLLSWVMGRAGSGSAWITVMCNINVIAVAVLFDASCIILAEGAQLDNDSKCKAIANNVAVLSSKKNAFELSGLLYKALLL